MAQYHVAARKRRVARPALGVSPALTGVSTSRPAKTSGDAAALILRSVITVLVMLVSADDASAQPVAAGDSVRVRFAVCPALSGYRCGEWLRASVTAVDGTSVGFTSSETGPFDVLHDDVGRIELYAGRRTAFNRGFAIGAVAGGLATAAIATILVEDPGPCGAFAFCFSKGFIVTFLSLSGAGAGGFIGGLIGYSTGVDHWVAATLEQTHVSIDMRQHGVGLGLSVSIPLT